jgi:antirestriction protein ArdC
MASVENYCAVLIHEITHWTKHPSRLDRDLGRKRWSDAGCALKNSWPNWAPPLSWPISISQRRCARNMPLYIQSWLKALKDDKRAVFSAAAHAQRAADYLIGVQPDRVRAVA